VFPQIAGLTALDRTQVLQQLHREEHVDVARQVDVFEKEMRADDEEIAQLSLEEQKAEALYSEEARPVLAIMMEAAKKMVSKVSQWVGSATAAPVTVLAKLKAC
jgi:hypothetical protein